MCKICGRSSCSTSFHSIEDQEAFDDAENMETRDVMYLIIENKDNESTIAKIQEAFDTTDSDDGGNYELREKLGEIL